MSLSARFWQLLRILLKIKLMLKNFYTRFTRLSDLEKAFLIIAFFPFLPFLNPLPYNINELGNIFGQLRGVFIDLIKLSHRPVLTLLNEIEKWRGAVYPSETISTTILVIILDFVALIGVGVAKRRFFLQMLVWTILLALLSVGVNRIERFSARGIFVLVQTEKERVGTRMSISVKDCKYRKLEGGDRYSGDLKCTIEFSNIPGIETIPETYKYDHHPEYRVTYASYLQEENDENLCRFDKEIKGFQCYYATSYAKDDSEVVNGKITITSKINIRHNTQIENLYIARFQYWDQVYDYGFTEVEIPVREYLE
jgi:hypothetical protein